jgi:hypothetical protein
MTPGQRREWAPLVLCVCVGLSMVFLPNLLWWPRLGEPVCIDHHDEMFYLAVGSQAYFNHPTYLSDPTLATGGSSLYRQLPLLPGVLIARAFGIGPIGIDLVWRLLAGASIPLGWYMLARHYIRRPWIVLGVASMLMTDHGVLGGNLLLRQGSTCLKVMRGRLEDLFTAEMIHLEWRFATPALTMAYYLLHLWLLARAREHPTRLRLLLSGLGFGLLFHVYPFYWTAAGGALILSLALDAGHRHVYLWTGTIGGLIGLPRIIGDVMLKRSTSADWLIRSGKFLTVPLGSHYPIPLVGTLVALIGFVWVFTRRRDLIPLWATGASGLALFNHHAFTGIMIENYHWMYVWGPALALLALLMVVPPLVEHGRWGKAASACLVVILALDMAAGYWLRAFEARRNPSTIDRLTQYRHYRDQRLTADIARFPSNATVAGDVSFVDFAVIFENQRPLDNYWVFLSPYCTDAEWDRRKALNYYLSGVDPSDSEESLRKTLGSWNWTTDRADEERRVTRRLAEFRAVERDLDVLLDRYDVRIVALQADRRPPKYLSKGWARLQDGPYWQVWERRR